MEVVIAESGFRALSSPLAFAAVPRIVLPPMNPLHEILAFLRTTPFRPFAIRTSEGREFRILHTDFLTVTARGKILFETDDTAAFISPLHVVSVDSLPESARA